jgi:DNA repair photolyase
VRQLFEPKATPIIERVNAISQLHNAGIKTFAMIAPLLPGAEKLVTVLRGKVDYIIIDKMNYHYVDWVYRKYGSGDAKSRYFMTHLCNELVSGFQKQGLNCQELFE